MISTSIKWFSTFLLFTCLIAACGEEGDSVDGPGGATVGKSTSQEEIGLGGTGQSVTAVQTYLATFGYLPNAELQKRYPAWRPVVATNPVRGLYDEITVNAVTALQLHNGLAPTGVVDKQTWDLMSKARCGVPENIVRLDGSDKFALAGTSRGSTVTWKVSNTDDVTLVQARTAAAAAFATWASRTRQTFVEVFGSTVPNIEIKFVPIDGGGDILGRATFPPANGTIEMDTGESWVIGSTGILPNWITNRFDLQGILLHEIGHSLGLEHTGSPVIGVMYPIASASRSLSADDIFAIEAVYRTNRWQQMPDKAKDIGISPNAEVWKIGTTPVGANFTIHQRNGSGWQQSDGAAFRIAVDINNRPWVVTFAGAIFRRTSSSALSGSWEQMPGSAQDIGAGADGSVWIVGGAPSAPSDAQTYKWAGSALGWTPAQGVAVRIAVAEDGRPWVVSAAGDISRRKLNFPPNQGWESLPGKARDIGIGRSNYAWVIGNIPIGNPGDFNVMLWNENGGVAPVRREWITSFVGAAISVAVQDTGVAWLVNSAGDIFRYIL